MVVILRIPIAKWGSARGYLPYLLLVLIPCNVLGSVRSKAQIFLTRMEINDIYYLTVTCELVISVLQITKHVMMVTYPTYMFGH